MSKHQPSCSWMLLIVLAGLAQAQVVSPSRIKDAQLRLLQVQYNRELTDVGRDILSANFEYPFFLSAALDLDEAEQRRAINQSSIRFEHYDQRTVLAVSGNYYAAYAEDKVGRDARARESFLKVVVPILKAAVPRFESNEQLQGYAVEISHHVARSAMGVALEQPENLMVYLPQADAVRLLASADKNQQQAALLDGKAYLNGEPISIWLDGDSSRRNPVVSQLATAAPPKPVIEPMASPQFTRDVSPQALQQLQTSKQQTVADLVAGLNSEAHFVSYAPPEFVAFRQGAFLEFSLITELTTTSDPSRYKLAAMAFDEHIAHLVRPFTSYFHDATDFDGISFSTIVSASKASGSATRSEAVEFFFTLPLLRRYQQHDCTGQQLIDGSSVLINGEPVSLDLQSAER